MSTVSEDGLKERYEEDQGENCSPTKKRMIVYVLLPWADLPKVEPPKPARRPARLAPFQVVRSCRQDSLDDIKLDELDAE